MVPSGVAPSGIALLFCGRALPAIVRSAAALSGIVPSCKPASGSATPGSAAPGGGLAIVNGLPLPSRIRRTLCGPAIIATARKPFAQSERFDHINLLDRTIRQIHNRRTNNDLAEAAP